MDSIIVARMSGVVTLVGATLSSSTSRSVMEVKIDALTEKIEKHNQLIKRTYRLEEGLAVMQNAVDMPKVKVG